MVMDIGYDYELWWTRPKIRDEDTPLTIWHLLLLFILLLGALVLSTITFCIEINGRKMNHKMRVWLKIMMAMVAEIIGAIQRSKKWLVCGLVKFATAVARLICPDLLG